MFESLIRLFLFLFANIFFSQGFFLFILIKFHSGLKYKLVKTDTLSCSLRKLQFFALNNTVSAA